MFVAFSPVTNLSVAAAKFSVDTMLYGRCEGSSEV